MIKTVKVVIALIYRDYKLLLTERPADKPYPGYWELPGGKVEAGESALEALVRELTEELGIVVTHANSVHHYIFTYPDRTVDLDVWHVSSFTGEPFGRENQRLFWAKETDLTTLNLLPGIEPIFPIIQTFYRSIIKG